MDGDENGDENGEGGSPSHTLVQKSFSLVMPPIAQPPPWYHTKTGQPAGGRGPVGVNTRIA